MATKTVRFTPRKEPVQARSRLTVKAILQATAQVLVTRGYECSTTDAIANRAGVSIGTLYQYFPNKESLVAALIREHVEEILTTVGAALARHADSSMEVALRAIIHAGVEAHRIDPPLHKVFFEQVPRHKNLGEALDASGKLQSMIEDFFRRKAPEIPRSRLRMIALVVESSVEALTHRAVVEAPDWLRSGEMEKETVRLLQPYLREALC